MKGYSDKFTDEQIAMSFLGKAFVIRCMSYESKLLEHLKLKNP